MKRFSFAVAILAFVLAAFVGLLYLAVPPNEMPEEGLADPFISVRRPVLAFLRAVGIVHGPTFFTGWYLPTAGGSKIWDGGSNGTLLCKMEIAREPVYRGIFWLVGYRITYRKTHFDDERSEWQVLRLCYSENGRKFVAGEGTVENGMLDPGGQHNTVRGYVPRSASGYWVEGVDKHGDVHSQDAWGNVRKFWRE